MLFPIALCIKHNSTINGFNAATPNVQLLPFTRGTVRRIQRQNGVKKKLMTQASHLARYQRRTLLLLIGIVIIIIVFAVTLEI